MQDDFNSAPTPGGLPIPPAPGAPGQPRTAGQPLGVFNPQAPQGQGQAQPAQAPGQIPGQIPGWAGQTVSYHGQVTLDPATVADAQLAAVWPGTPGAVSPFAPTVQRLPSGPKPPIYQPPGLPPVVAPALPAPAPPAPVPVPAPRVPARVPARVPPRASSPAPRPWAGSAPALAAGARRGGWSRWIPLPHTLLLLGVALLLVATYLPWGVDGSGDIIMLQTASVPALAGQGSNGTALQVAYDLIAAVGGLSVALLLSNVFLSGLNKLLGRGCVAGCVITPLYPILLALIVALVVAQALAAGFGGLGALAQAPGAQSYGLAGLGVAHYEPGYYIWYTGIILNVAGMFGEMVVWRR